MKAKTKVLFVKLTESDHARLRREADALEMSIADLVRRSVKMGIPILRRNLGEDDQARVGG